MAESTSGDIAAAVKTLREGGLVAFPTETVYGLGADARSSSAVQKIFAAKGRPSTNPLIVHVADESIARRYAAEWPRQAEQLASRFWPGPLTLVLPKSPHIVAEATAGLDTVGLRIPNHPVALRLLHEFDGPVAAPSANRSGRVSPTTAEHVRSELGDRVGCILDGGDCQVGIESTVLALLNPRPVILRPGGVSQAQIEQLIGPVTIAAESSSGRAALSPGMGAEHYRPSATVYRIETEQIGEVIQRFRRNPQQRTWLLIIAEMNEYPPLQKAADELHRLLNMPNDAEAYAHKLYATLHDADQCNVSEIWIQMPPDEPPWRAVRDRLTRASQSM
jgi:L-threonylcarbamoyladenylate synthase